MIECTPGYLCDGNGVTAATVKCPVGYYCLKGSSTSNANGNKKSCPVGYYCIEGSAEPIPCPAGTYRNSLNMEKLADCTLCTVNYYCPNVAATSVDTTNHKCDPGFTCAAGSTHPRVLICPKGFKCP